MEQTAGNHRQQEKDGKTIMDFMTYLKRANAEDQQDITLLPVETGQIMKTMHDMTFVGTDGQVASIPKGTVLVVQGQMGEDNEYGDAMTYILFDSHEWNTASQSEFESWASDKPFNLVADDSLRHRPTRKGNNRTVNPYTDSLTRYAYDLWMASRDNDKLFQKINDERLRLALRERDNLEMTEKLTAIARALDAPRHGDFAELISRLRENIYSLRGRLKQAELAKYWLVRLKLARQREGWEAGPTTDNIMDRITDFLFNRGLDAGVEDHQIYIERFCNDIEQRFGASGEWDNPSLVQDDEDKGEGNGK